MNGWLQDETDAPARSTHTAITTTANTAKSSDDEFDSILNIEEEYYLAGKQLGMQSGIQDGRAEGWTFGVAKGREIGEEVGELEGMASFLLAVHRKDKAKIASSDATNDDNNSDATTTDSKMLSERSLRTLDNMVSICEAFPLGDPHSDELMTSLEKLHSLQKMLQTRLGLTAAASASAGATSATTAAPSMSF